LAAEVERIADERARVPTGKVHEDPTYCDALDLCGRRQVTRVAVHDDGHVVAEPLMDLGELEGQLLHPSTGGVERARSKPDPHTP
jgi:hypothetical protein